MTEQFNSGKTNATLTAVVSRTVTFQCVQVSNSTQTITVPANHKYTVIGMYLELGGDPNTTNYVTVTVNGTLFAKPYRAGSATAVGAVSQRWEGSYEVPVFAALTAGQTIVVVSPATTEKANLTIRYVDEVV